MIRQVDGEGLHPLQMTKFLPEDSGRIVQDWISVSETRDIEIQFGDSLQVELGLSEVLISYGPSRTSQVHTCIRREEDAAILPA